MCSLFVQLIKSLFFRPEVVTTYLHEKALSSLQKAVEIAEETTTDGSSPSQLAEAYFELAKFSSQGIDDNFSFVAEEIYL